MALINETEKVSSNLRCDEKEGFVVLLKQKIEECVIKGRSIIINISEFIMECRNTFFIDDYEVSDKFLYLNNENFEVHINLKESKIEYDDTFNEITFTHENTEVKLYFE